MALTYSLSTGASILRKEIVDGVIKDFTQKMFVFRDALTVQTTGAWKNTYMQENPAILTANGQTSFKGVAPGADFPESRPTYTERTARILKFAGESTIIWEDILAGDVDIQTRTLLKLSEGIRNAVDSYIWDELSENRTAAQIQTFTISPGYQWNAVSAAIFDDLARAEQLLKVKNYWQGNLICFLSPRDERSVKNYMVRNGIQFNNVAGEVLRNGKIGTVNGFEFRVSNNVTTSYSMVVVPKICATYKELVPLSTDTKEEAFQHVRVRAVMEGAVQITDPLAIVLIANTQDAAA